jgi:heme/copper-type cytochrome/quinol oxidase subunit 4
MDISQLQSGKERVIGFASRTVTVTVIFLLSQEHSQRDQIYVFKILFCLTVQSHLHQIQYVHMAHGFPPPCKSCENTTSSNILFIISMNI